MTQRQNRLSSLRNIEERICIHLRNRIGWCFPGHAVNTLHMGKCRCREAQGWARAAVPVRCCGPSMAHTLRAHFVRPDSLPASVPRRRVPDVVYLVPPWTRPATLVPPVHRPCGRTVLESIPHPELSKRTVIRNSYLKVHSGTDEER